MEHSRNCETPGRPYLIGVNSGEKRAVLFQPRCKLWSCPICGQTNKARWTIRAYQGVKVLIERGKEVDFLTLTSHERLDPIGTIIVFKHAWDQLNKRIRRAVPNYSYLLVPEQHKDGRLHAHLIETSGLPKRWFKDNARECGLGYEVDVDTIRSPEGGAFYVAKYLGKQLEAQQWPKGFRHVRTSRDFPPLPALEKLEGWEWRPLKKNESLEEIEARYCEAGFHIIRAGSHSAWEYVQYGIVDT